MVDPSAAERRKTNRLRFMHALYDTTHGSTTVPIDSSTVAVRLGIDEVEADAMVANLQEEGLLSIVGVSGLSSAIMLTHQGLVEVEQS